MAIKKLSKKQIDADVLRLLLLNEAIKMIKKEHTALKNSLEAQYIEDAKTREIIFGSSCEFEKIPVNTGAHAYDSVKAKVYTDAIGKTADVIKTVEIVDSKKFEALAKDGFIPETVLDKCRLDKWTFKSDFRRKEVATQKKISKSDVDVAINKVLAEIDKVQKKPAKAKKVVGQ